MFPNKEHAHLVEDFTNLTPGQADHLYAIYRKGVLTGKIGYYQPGGEFSKEKIIINYLKSKGNYGTSIVPTWFLVSLDEFQKMWKTGRWINPWIREQEQDDSIEAIGEFMESVSAVTDPIIDTAGKAAKKATEALGPILWVTGIAGVAFIGWKTGMFKKLAKK